jgi:hypothetical protein
MAPISLFYKPPHRPDLYNQKLGMMIHQPRFASKVVKDRAGRRLICQGDVQPTPSSDIYPVRIEYRMMYRPMVCVLGSKLKRVDPDVPITHTFADDRPCLFRNEWNSRMLIATSIVPWLMLWLFFYESWAVTGVWQGGGHEEEPIETDEREVQPPTEYVAL